jgi:hypothetical protein
MPSYGFRSFGVLGAWVLAAALLASACSPTRAPVTFGIVYRGGPAPGTSDQWRPGTVRILEEGESLVAARHLTEGETWTVDLQPGWYEVDVQSGDAQCSGRRIDVGSGTPLSVRMECQVR